jgi:membrane protein
MQHFRASLQGLLRILAAAVSGLARAETADRAAAVAFYTIVSLFPLVLGSIAVAAHFVDPEQAVREVLRLVQGLLPQGAALFEGTIRGVIETRGSASTLSIAALLWSGTRVFSVLARALSHGATAASPPGRLRAVRAELARTLLFGSFAVGALGAGILLDLAAAAVPILSHSSIEGWLRLLLPGLGGFGMLALLYRYIPTRPNSWRASIGGAAMAGALLFAVRPAFVAYVQKFGQWNLVYGSLAVVIALLFWAWLVALIVLFGGEVAAQITSGSGS